MNSARTTTTANGSNTTAVGSVTVKVKADFSEVHEALAELDQVLDQRIKAAKAAAEVLQTRRAGVFNGAPTQVAVQDVIDLGDWLLGETYEDEDEAPAEDDAALAEMGPCPPEPECCGKTTG